MASVFSPNLDKNYFQWQHIPYAERIHWNYLLQRVVAIDGRTEPDLATPGATKHASEFIMDDRLQPQLDGVVPGGFQGPNFYNQNFCLALTLCQTDQRSQAPEPTGDEPKGRKGGPRDSPQTQAALFDTEFKLPQPICWDDKEGVVDLFPYAVKPHFNYHRGAFEQYSYKGNGTSTAPTILSGYSLQSLTVGSLIWLYFYERMGIFKILGVLLDDYNYRGNYSLSSQVRAGVLKNKHYIELLEHLSMLTRQGLASTFRDRISTYQRVLGVTVQNDLNVQSTENTPFMKNFSKLISNMLEYYNAKRLAMAIQNNTAGQVRSSVATQTAILNTIKSLCQNFEVMEYGRNMVHTFTGIATVYVTICLIKQIRDVIGIPREYDTPEEYIPAAYDILVLKKQGRPSDANRYTIFDDCASYGYRILTDVQLAEVSSIRLGEQNTAFDAWLANIEEWVEGYNNAFKSIPDKTNAETSIARV